MIRVERKELASMFSNLNDKIHSIGPLASFFNNLEISELDFYGLDSIAITTHSHASFHAVGTIEGKFDHGYFVSVKVGTEMLHGVLYHPGQSSGSTVIVPAAATTPSASAPPPPVALPALKRARKSRKQRVVDPQRPKPNRSGYNFFFAERHTALKSRFPEREREFTKMIGNAWTNLPQEQKRVYNDYGVRDKERYKKELEEYKTMIKGKGKAKSENA